MHVSNSDPYGTDPKNGHVWVQEGRHMMVVVPKAMLKGISGDSGNGGPNAMRRDTPYAYIMPPLPEHRSKRVGSSFEGHSRSASAEA